VGREEEAATLFGHAPPPPRSAPSDSPPHVGAVAVGQKACLFAPNDPSEAGDEDCRQCVLADSGVGPRPTHFQRFEGDPNPVDVDFRFERFAEVTPDAYASDHCPVFFEVP